MLLLLLVEQKQPIGKIQLCDAQSLPEIKSLMRIGTYILAERIHKFSNKCLSFHLDGARLDSMKSLLLQRNKLTFIRQSYLF